MTPVHASWLLPFTNQGLRIVGAITGVLVVALVVFAARKQLLGELVRLLGGLVLVAVIVTCCMLVADVILTTARALP